MEIVYAIAISFQISGAILLLIWSFRTTSELMRNEISRQSQVARFS